MEIFFHKLTKVLDKERSDWRSNTIILLDNATYHTSVATLKVFKVLRIPILFTGPHSYDGAPCELFFAAFKRADINPKRVGTGKK
jgi:transposase